MADRGVGSWIERRSRVAPDRVALVHGPTRRTYRELAERIDRLADTWRTMGVDPGARVVWRGPNHPAFLESLFASARLGAILAPVNHRLDGGVARALVDRYAPTLVVEHEVDPLPGGRSDARVLRVGADGDAASFEDAVTAGRSAPLDGAVDLGAPCLLPHTSGTTGPPRGVVLTHRNVTANVVNVLSVTDLSGRDVTVAIAPFFRTGGTGVNVLPVLFQGGTVVIPEAPGPDELLQLVERERVTVGFANPDLLDALARSSRWPDADLSSVRWFLTGGAPVPARLVHAYRDRGVTFLQGYGLSEAAPVVLFLDADHALAKTGAAGTPPMFVDVRTVRADGTPCAVGETGELQVDGPNVMAGYWDDEDATRAAFGEDGWLRTGDAARVDADGFVWIVDRMSEAFEVSGRTVFPADVERVLLDHADVRDAGVSERGAFVVPEEGATLDADELRDWCRARLQAHEVPTRVLVVDALPRSSVGKLLRAELGPAPG